MDKTDMPIEFANVIVSDKNNAILGGTTTDPQGNFHFKIGQTKCRIRISFLGFEDWVKDLTIDGNTPLGGISLTESKNDLGEVVVIAEKPLIEKKIDRLIFNLEHSISASGGTVLDALRKTPGVAVGQEGSLRMIGKGSVSVLIDDRLLQLSGDELTNFLESIASDDVKSIEVITTPPAKYEAEGNGGLINIIYKKGRKNAWNNSVRTSIRQATFPSYSLGNTFSYYKNKLRLFVSADARRDKKKRYTRYSIDFQEPRSGERNIKRRTRSFSGRFGLDYELSDKISVGAQYLGGFKAINNYTKNDIYDGINAIKTRTFSIISNGMDDKDISNHSANLHYLQRLDSMGNKLSVDLDYFTYSTYQDKNLVSTTFSTDTTVENQTKLDLLLNIGAQRIENYSAKIDVEHPASWAEISYGAKASFTHTNNLINYQYHYNTFDDLSLRDSSQVDRFVYTENTEAAYIDFAKELKKWTLKLGLRAEYTQTKAESQENREKNQKNKYLKLFPALYMLYAINDDHSVNINYNRRISRPEFLYLDPFRRYLSNVSYSVGNPFLRPSFTDKIELSHTYKNKLISTLFFSNTTDGFDQIPKIDSETKEQVYNMKNFFTLYQYGISESYTLHLFPWWSSRNVASLYYSEHTLVPAIDAVIQNGLVVDLNTYQLSRPVENFLLKEKLDFQFTFHQFQTGILIKKDTRFCLQGYFCLAFPYFLCVFGNLTDQSRRSL